MGPFIAQDSGNSAALLEAIKRREGYAPEAKWDYKQHSVGYGTRARYPGEIIDRTEADRRLNAEVAKARGIVESFAPGVDEGTKSALTSLTYNAGDKWTRSGLGKAIKAGDAQDAKLRFLQYNKADGKMLPGLVDRRRDEASWFSQGALPAADGDASSAAPAPFVAASEPTSAAPSVSLDDSLRAFTGKLGKTFEAGGQEQRKPSSIDTSLLRAAAAQEDERRRRLANVSGLLARSPFAAMGGSNGTA